MAKSLDVQYGIRLEARPDAEMKKAVIIAATKSAQSNKITPDEELFIIEQIMSGQNPREVRSKLRKMMQQNRKQEEMFKQQAIQLQGQQNAQLAAEQAKSAERIKALEVQAKDAEIRTQAQATIVTRHHDSDMKIREMVAQHQIENGQMPNVGTEQQGQMPQQPMQQPAQPVQPPVQPQTQP